MAISIHDFYHNALLAINSYAVLSEDLASSDILAALDDVGKGRKRGRIYFLKTGTRRIIEFFLAPLLQHGQESLRER